MPCVDGAVVAAAYDESRRETLRVTEDGVTWSELADLASGDQVTCPRGLVAGPGRALCLGREAGAAWVIRSAGASRLVSGSSVAFPGLSLSAPPECRSKKSPY